MARRELLPALLGRGIRHPLVDQEQVRPGDRLVVEPRVAVEGGEALQRGGEARQRLERRVPPQVDPGQPHVVAVVELGVGEGAVLEASREVVVVHRLDLLEARRKSAPKAKAPGKIPGASWRCDYIPARRQCLDRVVPETGLEPVNPCGWKILSLLRIPFRHSGRKADSNRYLGETHG